MEDCKYKLSIIVPMYNAEQYIGSCLNSIIESDLPKDKYEVIIINDGSKDNGPAIAKEYVSKYENFIYLEQENQGQSVARNNGIRKSYGEYVWCVDADDKVDSSLNCLLQLLAEFHVDIMAFQLKQVTESGDYLSIECSQPNVKHNCIMKGSDAIISGYRPSSVCALVIRKQLMIDNSLFFKKGITHQDVELSYKLFAHAGDVYFSDIKPYIYIKHPNSTTTSIKPEKRKKKRRFRF